MKKYLAEMVGTFILVFGGCGSAVLAGQQIGFLGVSIAFGLTLLAMAYAIGHISGCHINPAVTVGLLVSKKMDSRDVVGYIVGLRGSDNWRNSGCCPSISYSQRSGRRI